MTEPDNLTLVLIGNLTDNDPWNIELWARDDDEAAHGSTDRWHRTGTGDDGQTPRQHVSRDWRPQRVSWKWLQTHAREHGGGLTVLGSGAR